MTKKKLEEIPAETPPKRKPGGQPGNKNAAGKKRANPSGGAPKGNKNAKGGRGNPSPKPTTKHGGYSRIFWESLTPEEQELIDTMPQDPADTLRDSIKLLTIREYRLNNALKQYGDAPYYEAESLRTETRREFKNETERRKYDKAIKAKVEAGERLPGDPYTESTKKAAAVDVVIRLQRELSYTTAQKAKLIMQLEEMKKEAAQNSGHDDLVTAWVNKIREIDAEGRRGASDDD